MGYTFLSAYFRSVVSQLRATLLNVYHQPYSKLLKEVCSWSLCLCPCRRTLRARADVIGWRAGRTLTSALWRGWSLWAMVCIISSMVWLSEPPSLLLCFRASVRRWRFCVRSFRTSWVSVTVSVISCDPSLIMRSLWSCKCSAASVFRGFCNPAKRWHEHPAGALL